MSAIEWLTDGWIDKHAHSLIGIREGTSSFDAQICDVHVIDFSHGLL
jgi:hypothetical protein